jgi:RHS repeat-associated protein
MRRGKKVLKAMKVRLCALLLLAAAVADMGAEGIERIPVESVRGSISSAALGPAEYVIDGSTDTGWAIANDSQAGWLELTLSEMTDLYGLSLYGSLGEKSGLRVFYETEDGLWQPFCLGYLSALAPGWNFVNLAGDGVRAERVRIEVSGEDASLCSLNEVEVIGERSSRAYRKFPLELSDSGDDSLFYPAKHLVDGNTKTIWHSEQGKGWNGWGGPFDSSSRSWIEGCIRTGSPRGEGGRPAWGWNEGDVAFRLPQNSRIYKARVYLHEGYRGPLIVEEQEGFFWRELFRIEEGEPSGWKSVEFPGGVESDGIRLTVYGSRYQGAEEGGIGELELWGNAAGDLEPTSLIDVGGKDLTGGLYAQCSVEEPQCYRMSLVLNKDVGQAFTVEVNDTELSLERVASLEGKSWYEGLVARDMLLEGENLIAFSAHEDTSILTGSLIPQKADGVVSQLSGVSAYRKLSLDGEWELVYRLDGELVPERIDLTGEHLVSEQLYYEQDGQWLPMAWSREYEYGQRWQSGPGDEPIETTALKIANARPDALYGIRVIGSLERNGAPEIEMRWPVNGELVELGGIGQSVVGYVDDPRAKVSINGIAAQQRGHLFWGTLRTSGWGDQAGHELLVRAVDEENRESQKLVRWYDKESLLYSVNLPEGISYTLENSILVSGRMLPTMQVIINGQEIEGGWRGFSHRVELSEGLNRIELLFIQGHRDEVGRLMRKVFRVNQEPSLIIAFPESPYYTSKESVSITGRVQVQGHYRLWAGRFPVEVEGGRFTTPVFRLREGEQAIDLELRDQFGRRVDKQVRVVRDTNAPIIEAVRPESGTVLTSSITDFEADVAEENSATVFLDGRVMAEEGGVYLRTVDLVDGSHRLVLTARDEAGNRSETSLLYQVDTEAPLPFEIKVIPEGWTSNQRPVIRFETTDAVTGVDHYELSIDDGDFLTVTSGYQLPLLEDGVHRLVVKAFDKVGHERLSTTQTKIDTIPPVAVTRLDILPGNGHMALSWDDGDDDIISYEIERNPGWSEGSVRRIDRMDLQGYTDTEVENGTSYVYRVRGVDRAENIGSYGESLSAVPGIASATIEDDGVTAAEYESAALLLPEGSTPEGAVSVRIAEADPGWQESEDEAFEHDFVGPVYSFELLDGTGEICSEGELFNEPFVGVISYDKNLIPEGFPEENLNVYTFDTRWGRWVKVNDSAVDTEHHTIAFTSFHFSLYAPVATSVEDISPEEMQDAGFSPFRTYAEHEGLWVSPQGGNIHTSMTELVLPGPNSFDFTLKRYYDLSVAKMDERAESPSWALPYLEDQGDFSYSMGKGWRLNLPYIKNANSEQYLVMPEGGMYGFYGMELRNNPDGGKHRSLVLENHLGEDFSLSVSQKRSSRTIYFIGAEGVSQSSWTSTGYSLVTSDGTVYSMDEKGRTTNITSPDGFFSVGISYASDGFQIKTITDAIGRVLKFKYETADETGLSYISEIALADDPYGRVITYKQDEAGHLLSSIDAGERSWNYGYDSEYQVAGVKSPVPFDVDAAKKKYKHLLSKKIDKLSEPVSHYSYTPLSSMEGPGTGRIKINYGAFGAGEDDKIYSRVLAQQVTIYDMIGKQDDVRMTRYSYDYDKVSDKLGYYLAETTVDEVNSSRFTTYTYGYYRLVDSYWTEKDRSVEKNIRYDENAVANRPTAITWYEKQNNSREDLVQLRSQSIGYENEYAVCPQEKTTRQGEAIQTVRYAYDGWGNVIREEQKATAWGRERRSVIHRVYYGQDESSDGPWKGYEESGLSCGTVAPGHRDLLLMECVENYVPGFDEDGIPVAESETALVSYRYYGYDDRGRKTGVAEWDSVRGEWNVGSYEWDENGDMVLSRDAEGHLSYYRYAADHTLRMRTEEDVAGEDGNSVDLSWEYTYDWSGWKRSERDARGYETKIAYDRLGRTTERREAGDDGGTYVITVSYVDQPGALASTMSDSMGRKVVREFNDLGRLIRQRSLVKAGTEAVVELSYDRWGNVTGMINPNAGQEDAGPDSEYTTRYGYDALGRLEKIEYPYKGSGAGNPSKVMAFDYGENLLTITDEEGNRTTEKQDLQGNVLERTQSLETGNVTTEFWYDGLGQEIARRGPVPGAVVSTVYDSLGRVISVRQPETEVYESGSSQAVRPAVGYGYDRVGRQTEQWSDAPGGSVRGVITSYDGLGRKSMVEYARAAGAGDEPEILAGEAYFYDAADNVLRSVDANGLERRYEYTPRNHVSREIDPEGGETCYTYYADGQVKSATDPRGESGNYPEMDFTVEYEYDLLNRLVRAELPPKQQTGPRLDVQFSYDLLGNLRQKVGVDGLVTRYEYTPRRWLSLQQITGDGKSYLSEYRYDRCGNVRESIDARGFSTVMKYDALGRMVYKKSPEGNITRYGYNEAGKVDRQQWTKDGQELVVRSEYDPFGRMLVRYRPLPASLSASQATVESSYGYDRLGNMSYSRDALGNERRYEYDELNRLIEEVSADGFRSTYAYDAGGRMTESVDPRETVSVYQYNGRGELTSRSLSGAGGERTVISYGYDEAGSLKWASDDGVVTAYNGYDAGDPASYRPDVYGRVTGVRTSIGGRNFNVGYGYDLGDRISRVSYPDGQDVSYRYNLLGELEDVAGYLSESPEYDEGGLLTEITAANGVRMSLGYDEDGRMRSRGYAGVDASKEYELSYDEAGNISRMNDNYYSYDEENRLRFAVLSGAFGVEPSKTEQESLYVEADDVTGDGVLAEVEESEVLRLDYAAGSIGVDLKGSYDVARVFVTGPGGSRVKGEDLRLFVSDSNEEGSWNEVSGFRVEEEREGSFTLVLDEAVAARYVKVKTDYNERDERYRAVDRSEYREAASKMIRVYYYVDQRSEEYGYDAAGNRKRFELSYSGAEGESREYVYYPGGNRLAGDGRYAYAYDENGNLRAKGTRLVVAGQSVAVGDVSDWSRYESSLYGEEGSPVFSGDGSLREYEYDLLNRLVRVKVDGIEVAGYRYDAQGLRVEKESDEGSRYYVFDLSGNVVWEEGDQESLTYVYVGGKRFALEEVREGKRNRYYYHSDHLGSTVLVTGEDGKVVWDGDYTPFGRLYDERGGKDHTVQFTGKEYDGDSGLYYFNARWYEADLGRFISEDPARDGGNWYVYAGNNPLRYVDPSGMFLEKVKEKVRGAIDRIKESWDRGVERQKEKREQAKHERELLRIGEAIQSARYQLSVDPLGQYEGAELEGYEGELRGKVSSILDTELVKHDQELAKVIESMDPINGEDWDKVASQFGKRWGREWERAYLNHDLKGKAITVATTMAAGYIMERIAGGDWFSNPSSFAAPGKGGSFFEGTQYSQKVLQQMEGGAGEFHSFPEAVKAFEGSGTVSPITGGDGVVRQMLEIPGSYQSASGSWYEGVFQFIKEPNGIINHRLFVPVQ